MVADCTFGPERRIRRRPEFQRVYDAGQRLGLRLMTVILAPNGREQSRLGVSATRKLGGSVVRNRAKRVVREVFRQSEVHGGLDIVVIPRPALLEAEYAAVESEFRYALRRARRQGADGGRKPPGDDGEREAGRPAGSGGQEARQPTTSDGAKADRPIDGARPDRAPRGAAATRGGREP